MLSLLLTSTNQLPTQKSLWLLRVVVVQELSKLSEFWNFCGRLSLHLQPQLPSRCLLLVDCVVVVTGPGRRLVMGGFW